MKDVCKEAERLFGVSAFSDAESLLRPSIETGKASQDVYALYGLALLFNGREHEAVDFALKSPRSKFHDKLVRFLADHFYCRTLLFPSDKSSARALKRLGAANINRGVKLSACLIVKNEEDCLSACLEGLAGLADEIVVVDTGSTDATLEIAKRYGAKIGHFKWNDDFSSARNESLKLATGDWVLWIDADERLTPESRGAIKEALSRSHFAGFNIPIVNFVSDSGDAEQVVHAPTRLFQLRPTTRFEGKIHEQVAPSLKSLGLPIGFLSEAKILHDGYRPARTSERGKVDRTITMLLAELEDHPDSSFQWFNLGNAYLIARRYPEAERACRMSLANLQGGESHAASAHQILIETLDQQGKTEEALETAEAALLAGYGSLVTFFMRAGLFLKVGRYDDALAAIEQCLNMSWSADLQGDFSIATFKRHLLHGQILGVLGRYEEAHIAIEKALTVAPSCGEAMLCQAALWERLAEFERALSRYEELTSGPLAAAARIGKARCLTNLKQTDAAIASFAEAFASERSNEAWIGWVQCAESSGDQAEVLRAYEAIASVYEPNVDILINWGRALEASGDFDRALACFSEALKRDDQNPNTYFNCGDLLYRMQLYSDAAHLYESGLRLSPLHPEGWFVLGNSLAQMGLVDGARLAYRQCLAIAPDHSKAKTNMNVLQEAFPQAS